jgi:hypothetical protein
VPISIYGIHMHLAHHSKPHIQRHIIRVLWMVPIYGLNAWLVRLAGWHTLWYTHSVALTDSALLF